MKRGSTPFPTSSPVVLGVGVTLVLCSCFAAVAGSASDVTLACKYPQSCATAFRTYLWIPRSVLGPLGMPTNHTCVSSCGSMKFGLASNTSTLGTFNIDQINVADGVDACNACGGCGLAFVQLADGEGFPDNYLPGTVASIEFSRHAAPYKPGPPAPPAPPPAPCDTYKSKQACQAAPGRRCSWRGGSCVTTPPPTPPTPPPLCRNFTVGGLEVGLRCGSRAVLKLGYSDDARHEPAWWGRNFSFQPPLSNAFPHKGDRSHPGSHWVGDVSLRVQPASCTNASRWGFYTSASAGAMLNATLLPGADGKRVLEKQEITALLQYRPTDDTFPLMLNVTRSWEAAQDAAGGLILRVALRNSNRSEAVRVGGFGFSLVPDTTWGGLNLTAVAASLSFLDPHVGGQGGWATWSRADGSRSMVVTPATPSAAFEAYRPLLEDAGHIQALSYEWTVHSAAWKRDWDANKQAPCPGGACTFPGDAAHRAAWPDPESPWPSWSGSETVRLPNPRQWHPPTSVVLGPGQSKEYALRFTLAEAGPRTVPATLEKVGVAVLRSVPGYVISVDLPASLLVKPPRGAAISSVAAYETDTAVIDVGGAAPQAGSTGWFVVPVRAKRFGRGSVNVTFSDGSFATAHYFGIGKSLRDHVASYGTFAAETAWLPSDYPDPFNRQDSIPPWDREDNKHKLQDGRPFIVGLSDDAGGGNHLGFASKVWHMPSLAEFAKVDTYINSTLLGKSKTCGGECADPYFSLQDPVTYKVLMTVFYFHYDAAFKVAQQHAFNGKPYYTELDKCTIGPSWCAFNAFADGKTNASFWRPADYRQYNYPHQIASYYAMYIATRNYGYQGSLGDWDFYLRAA